MISFIQIGLYKEEVQYIFIVNLVKNSKVWKEIVRKCDKLCMWSRSHRHKIWGSQLEFSISQVISRTCRMKMGYMNYFQRFKNWAQFRDNVSGEWKYSSIILDDSFRLKWVFSFMPRLLHHLPLREPLYRLDRGICRPLRLNGCCAEDSIVLLLKIEPQFFGYPSVARRFTDWADGTST
jgi:hypothetical protein